MIIEEIRFEAPESLFDGFHDRPFSFLLDSAYPSDGLGTWTFFGTDPFLVFTARGDQLSLDWRGSVEQRTGDALAELNLLLDRFRGDRSKQIPFTGGAVGYVSYEFGARREGVGSPPVLEDAPDLQFAFYDGILAFNEGEKRAYAVANPVHLESAADILGRLRRAPAVPRAAAPTVPSLPRPCLEKEAYLEAVKRIKDYIRAGDVYQVNLTQKFEAPLADEPYRIYQKLRRRNPAPFGCYLNFQPIQILGSSPERFLRIRDGVIDTRPIKGTRPRGATPGEDRRLAQALLSSEKDRAELLMIVDLERNDLGRVCDYGSIEVGELFKLESHPTVHHLVANVRGRLRAGCSAVDCLKALFPGGSITGAPKIRAMQIIHEIEACRRGIYTGSIGYMGFDGSCDLSIAIRTLFCREGKVSYHVGGGIVWDSDPEAEYQESLDKGRALREALCEP